MSTVLVEPAELQATAGQMLRTAAEFAAAGAGVLALSAGLPPVHEVELGPATALLGLRLERLAGEVAAEAARQEAVAIRALLADAAGAAWGFIDTRNTEFWAKVIQVSRYSMQETWSLAGRVVPFYVNVLGLGYRVERRGAMIVARGERLYQPGLLRDWIMAERLPGTRYLPSNARAATELEAFTEGRWLERAGAAAWQAVSHDAWALRRVDGVGLVRRGSGRVSLGLSLLPDAWDYSAWGAHRREGLASSGFASSLATDLLVSLGQTAVSAGTGAAVGSVVPVAGTAVGFGTGLVIGAAVEFTPWGRGARNAVQRAIKAEIDDSIAGGRELVQLAGQPVDPRQRPTGPLYPWQVGRL